MWRPQEDSPTTSVASRSILRRLPYAHCRKHPVCSSDIKSAFASLRIPTDHNKKASLHKQRGFFNLASPGGFEPPSPP